MAEGFMASLWRMLGLSPPPTPAPDSDLVDSAELKALGLRFWNEVFNQGDEAVIDEIFAPDFRMVDPTYKPDEVMDGVGVLKGVLSGVRVSLPDARATIEEQLVAEGNRLITRFFIEVPQTDPEAESDAPHRFHGCGISQIVDGRIQSAWVYWEAERAAAEIVQSDYSWRWPPWSWP